MIPSLFASQILGSSSTLVILSSFHLYGTRASKTLNSNWYFEQHFSYQHSGWYCSKQI